MGGGNGGGDMGGAGNNCRLLTGEAVLCWLGNEGSLLVILESLLLLNAIVGDVERCLVVIIMSS